MFVARDVRVGGLRLGHSTVEAGEQRGVATCAVERRFLLAGANPAQQLSLRLVAARAVYGGNDVD